MCLVETASAQTAEDSGTATEELRRRLAELCEGSGAASVDPGGVYGNCPSGRELQASLKFYIETAASAGRASTFAQMAKRELDDALAITQSAP